MGSWLAEGFDEGCIQMRELVGGLGIVLENVLTRCECKRIIEETERVGYGYTNFPQRYRGNRRLQLDDISGTLAGKIWQRIRVHVQERLEVDWMPDGDYPSGIWEAEGCNTRFRFSKYYSGDCFQKHADQLALLNSESCSFLTVNVYLNDLLPDQAGRTRFFADRAGDVVDAAGGHAGSLVLFKQEHALHDGERLSSGLKYLMRTDVLYKKVA